MQYASFNGSRSTAAYIKTVIQCNTLDETNKKIYVVLWEKFKVLDFTNIFVLRNFENIFIKYCI